MFRNMNAQSLWTNQKGAVAVEFSFIAIILALIMVLASELVMKQTLVGKLDRISYSLAGILRERQQLYAEREEIAPTELAEMRALAAKMLADMHYPHSEQVTIGLEALHFAPVSDLVNKNKVISLNQTIRDPGCVSPAGDLITLKDLSPLGSYGRWVPLYQVTVCLPQSSLFNIANFFRSTDQIVSYAVVMAR